MIAPLLRPVCRRGSDLGRFIFKCVEQSGPKNKGLLRLTCAMTGALLLGLEKFPLGKIGSGALDAQPRL
jgi:hypothetical protein